MQACVTIDTLGVIHFLIFILELSVFHKSCLEFNLQAIVIIRFRPCTCLLIFSLFSVSVSEQSEIESLKKYKNSLSVTLKASKEEVKEGRKFVWSKQISRKKGGGEKKGK